MLWVKSFHVIFMVTWFAGLFYLPRVFVYHATSDKNNEEQNETFKIMEKKLLGITSLGALLTIVFGVWLTVAWRPDVLSYGWMHAKLALVLGLFVYHMWCARIVKQFRSDSNTRSHVWYRWFNEVPVVGLVGIVILVIVQPF